MQDAVERLRSFMDEESLTRKELAQRLGYDVMHIHKVMCGASPITEAFVGRFFLAFGPDRAGHVFTSHAEAGA